jgi:hypothetical protein
MVCARLRVGGSLRPDALRNSVISGHTSLSEVARYTKQADRRHLADQALERQLRAEREQSVSEFTQHANPVPSGEKAVKKQ